MAGSRGKLTRSSSARSTQANAASISPGEKPPGRPSVVKETGFLELYLGKRGALQQYAAPECSLFSSTRRG